VSWATVTRAIPSFIVTIGLVALAWLATGSSFGLFLAGLFVLTVVLPPLVLTREQTRDRIAVSIAIASGIASGWLFASFNGTISFLQWMQCSLVLFAFGALLLGMAVVLVRCRIHSLFASAITVLLATLWLSWPIWLSPTLRDHSSPAIIHWLVQLNPAMAVNGVLLHLGPWTQEPMAYHLTDLGQNVAYALPVHGLECIIAHLLLGSVLFLFSVEKQRALP
jgi:hypothetical protein